MEIHPFKPQDSIFVSANAGAGKTRLLTDRVLALLLANVPPDKILCLTFTKAAAAEMKSRVQEELGRWVLADATALDEKLAELLDRPPENHERERARSLFAQVLESDEGVRMLTIHSLCQSLLRRFPLEAGVSPHFNIMDSRTEQQYQQEASQKLLEYANNKADALQTALHFMAREAAESRLYDMLREIFTAKGEMLQLLATEDGLLEAQAAIWRWVDMSSNTTEESIFSSHFSYQPDELKVLREICARLAELGKLKKTDATLFEHLSHWLENGTSIEHVAAYKKLLLTDKCEPRKQLYTKDAITDPDMMEALEQEKERMLNYWEEYSRLQLAISSSHLLLVSAALLATYQDLKRSAGLLDYDDQIRLAHKLLNQPEIMGWVLFKLDGGIDHILIDEAQDTSPTQWQIIQALTDEFFDGQGRVEHDRSIFIVGDEKQSIYSFQGAAPKELGIWQEYFARKCADAGKTAHHIARTTSYRSAPEILQAVDAIFAADEAQKGLSFQDAKIIHGVFEKKAGEKGLVEYWPLISPPEGSAEDEGDEDEKDAKATYNASAKLATQIADTIQSWLSEGYTIGTASPRPIEAGDIMILVRKRGKLVNPLVRALKRRNIPLAGQDRMNLNENLAVQDLIALGQAVLLPEDDLNLATLLKSPFGGISEEALFSLCHGRSQSVWQQMKKHSGDDKIARAYDLITDLRARAGDLAPYELYSYALEEMGYRRQMLGRMGREYAEAIDEFMDQALQYEQSHTPSLQGFIHWLNISKSEIKRDMEEAKGAVRIMTVHASKGLQAPIVILADTVMASGESSKNIIKWQERKNEAKLPIWATSKGKHANVLAELKENEKAAGMEEYRRLLYVALTRAETRLYICGAHGTKKPHAGSWCHLAQEGLKEIADVFEHPLGEGLRLGEALQTGTRQEKPLEKILTIPKPAYLQALPPSEPNPPQPLAPSHGEEAAGPVASPLDAPFLYQRGKLIHQLLQFLPAMPPSQRAPLAKQIIRPYEALLGAQRCNQALNEVEAVLDQPAFAHLFTEQGASEVPINGVILHKGKPVVVSGQIDRLIVADDAVWIIDYKSNYSPPDAMRDIPPAYLRQLRLYASLISEIYTDKTVRCALLWTAVPKLVEIPHQLLDETALTA